MGDFEAEAEAMWSKLSDDDKLKAFYSVMKRVHKGNMVERGTYRYVLYSVFGFQPHSYAIGMECGYFDIYNRIFESEGKSDG